MKQAFIIAYMALYGGNRRQAKKIYRKANRDFIQYIINA